MITREEVEQIISDDIKEYMSDEPCNTHDKILEICQKVEPFYYSTLIQEIDSKMMSFKTWRKYNVRVIHRLRQKFKLAVADKKISDPAYKLDSLLKQNKSLMKLIGETIGYSSDINETINDSYKSLKWSLDRDTLQIHENLDEDSDDYYEYTVSSYSAKGERLYMGEIGDLTLLMAYPSHERYDDTEIIILKTQNKIEL